MKTHRLLTILKILLLAGYYRLTGNKYRLAQVIYEGFRDLGGLYIKFLQIMMLRYDIFESWQLSDQLRVFEDVNTEPLDIKTMIQQELSAAQRAEFQLTSVEPFTAGSFGQVYDARLSNGTRIIIKALRPSLLRTLKFDLKLIGFTVRVIEWIKPGAMLDLRVLFTDFKEITLKETDYVQEASFGAMLHRRYQNHPTIVIPETYVHLTTKHLLFQEYVGGISVSALLEMKREGIEPVQWVRERIGSDLVWQMKELGFDSLYGMYQHDLSQGDPHPGNVKILPNNQVGLIDFGIAATSPSDRAAFLNLLKEYDKYYNGRFDVRSFSVTMLNLFASDLVAAIHKLDEFPDRYDPTRSIIEELGKMGENAFYSSQNSARMQQLLSRNRIVTIFSTIINKDNRFGLKVHFDAPAVMRAGQLFTLTIENLGIKQEILKDMYREVIERVEAEHELVDHKTSVSDVNRALEVISAWLDRISTRDPLLYKRISGHIGAAHV